MKRAILGLGSEMKGDDAVGRYVIDELKRRKSRHLLIHSDVPENSFNKLRKAGADSLTIIDAAHFSGKPGEIRVLDSIKEKNQLSTHSTSMTKLVAYLKTSVGIKDISLILIQAKNMEFGSEISPEVREAGEVVIELLS